MSFMVLNTGRVASQYFYINLKLQQHIIMPSRYQFDNVVKSFIKRRYKKPLTKLIQYRKNELDRQPGLSFGIVFHSARRNLLYPLSSEKNIEFLKLCKNELELDTVFFPVRDPDKVFKSELNRQLARIIGDWSFPIGMNGWQNKWRLNDCKIMEKNALQHDDCFDFLPKEFNREDLKDFSRKFIIDSAKIYSLYSLFEKVFENVKVFDYDHLFHSPKKVFSSMAKEKGFSFTDFSLTKTRLNSLPNRFMLYNSFTLEIDSHTQRLWNNRGISNKTNIGIKQKTSLKRIIIDKQNPFLRSCRFKFEIPEVISVCEDWGKYEQIDLVSDNLMPSIQNAIGSQIGIGIHSNDKIIFTQKEIKEMLKTIYLVICPRFDKNFKILIDYYKTYVYHRELPISHFYDDYKKTNKDEFLNMKTVLKSPEASLRIN